MIRAAWVCSFAVALAPVAHAGDSPFFEPEREARVVGVSADGSAYAVAIAGRFEDPELRNTCGYPAIPGVAAAGVDELKVEVRTLRTPPKTLSVFAWPVADAGLDKALCTNAATQKTQQASLLKALEERGIVFAAAPLPELAQTKEGVVIPAAALRALGVDADVTLRVRNEKDHRAWISVRADGYGDEKVQVHPAKIMVNGASATLLPGAPYVVVVPQNGRGWIFEVTEVPLARLAVRLLTARGERTGSAADLDAALKLDPSFERAQKARAKLAPPKP